MRVVRSGVYNVGLVRCIPVLFLFSDLLKSWGGECDGMQGHSIYCTRMLMWSRALAIARTVSYSTFGGKPGPWVQCR